MSDNHPYLNFDEYIRQGEPSQKEKALNWKTAIGLQAVDGLRVSDYLRNRYLHIHPTEEWSVQPNLADPTSTRTSTEQVPEQVGDLFHTNNQLIIGLIKEIGYEEISISQMMSKLGLKHRPNFLEYHLNPAISEGYVRMLYPQSPRHPRQKYLLTVKGLSLYKEITR